MKATKIRAYLVVPALAAVFGLSTYIASADAVSPTGPATASSSKVTIKLGTATVTCTSSVAHFDAQSSASGQPVCGSISPAPTLASCTVSAAGFSFAANCTTSGTWSLCASSSATSSLTIPTNGVVCTANILGQTCRATSTTAGAATLSGTYNNTTMVAAFNAGLVPVQTSGGFPCPSGTSASFTASYHVTNDSTGIGLQVTPN
jgi:hypothetical protein